MSLNVPGVTELPLKGIKMMGFMLLYIYHKL